MNELGESVSPVRPSVRPSVHRISAGLSFAPNRLKLKQQRPGQIIWPDYIVVVVEPSPS